MPVPKSIVIEYEDRTRREVPFCKLGRQTREELLSLGLEAMVPDPSQSYLLLQWTDGWREVIAADRRATELLRYYTVERVEEVGRLSLEIADDYPELLLIERLPSHIESIVFAGKGKLQTYLLDEQATVREGGKIEHIFYDKKRPHFRKPDGSAACARYVEWIDSLRQELQNKGVSATVVLAKSEEERIGLYKELAGALGLRATRRQQDIYGFLHAALEKLDAAETKAGRAYVRQVES